jgi:hypothetical protein
VQKVVFGFQASPQIRHPFGGFLPGFLTVVLSIDGYPLEHTAIRHSLSIGEFSIAHSLVVGLHLHFLSFYVFVKFHFVVHLILKTFFAFVARLTLLQISFGDGLFRR